MTILTERNIISDALKEYLKAIYKLAHTKNEVRITDISRYMSISKPSVNRAVNALKNAGLVEHRPYGSIFLTEHGEAEGERILKHTDAVARFLSASLDMDYSDAVNEANRITGKLSDNTLKKIVKLMHD